MPLNAKTVLKKVQQSKLRILLYTLWAPCGPSCHLVRLSSLQRCSCWSHPLALHGNISTELGEPRNFLQVVYILHTFITGIVTSFLHYAKLIVKNYMFHSTLIHSVSMSFPCAFMHFIHAGDAWL